MGANAGGGSAALGYLPARGAEAGRLGAACAVLRGRPLHLPGSLAGRPVCAPSSVPAAPRPSPSTSPAPGRSVREPRPAPRTRPSSARPARRLERPTEPRRGLRLAAGRTAPLRHLHYPQAAAPGRDGPQPRVPARLMSAAAAPLTPAGRCVRGASFSSVPSSTDEGRWAGRLRRDERARARDGPASGGFGGRHPTRGAGPGTVPELVAALRRTDLDPRQGTAFVPSYD